MGILSWIVMGLLVGFVASALLKRRGMRMLTLMLASLVGAVLGGMDVAFLYKVPGAVYSLNWIGLLVSLIGALLTVSIMRLVIPQKSLVG